MATTQTLGIVSPVPKGNWNSTTQYYKLNIVRYNNSSYIAISDNKGYNPSNTAYWMLLTNDVQLPSVSSSDNGKILQVSSGKWMATTLPIYNGETGDI